MVNEHFNPPPDYLHNQTSDGERKPENPDGGRQTEGGACKTMKT